MKKTIHAIAALSLVLASTSFAITKADTTILGQNYAKVTTCKDFDQVRTWTNNGEVVNVFVMNDIDCGNKNFAPIGQSEIKAFEGIFDGNGKTISGMNFTAVTSIDTLNLSETVAGFFGIIGKKGVVKNITISKSKTNVTSSNYAGILVGLNYGVIEGAKTTKSDTVKSSGDVGGIAGRNGGYGTMIGCENHATVKDGANAGGIAGANTGAISTSINYAAVSGTIAGGIVGNSHYRTILKEKITHVPGRIAACQNLGSVSGSKYAGGIVGENKDGSINNCRNDGSVAATNTNWNATAIAGGVVGYSYFDDNSKYSSGNYTAVVLNSFSTTNSVTGKTVGGVVGKVGNESSHKDYSKVENCYYDSQVLSKVTKAVGSEDNSTITTVKGETTANMNTNEDFVRVLNTQNGKIEYTFVWLFESGNYPVLDFSGCQGNYKITFYVADNPTPYLEATTVKGHIVEVSVTDPKVAGANFKGWKDDHGNVLTSEEAQNKFYSRSVTYHAVLNELFEITFVTDYGAELAKKSFEKNTMVFYYDEENGSEVPADLETDSATYKFTGWDRPFAAATKDTTYTAQFEKIAKTFTVTFFVQGETYDEQTVAFHANAQAPADPVVEGFRFDGWDKEFTDVTTDLEIDAKLVKTYNFCYFDLETKQCETVDAGTEVAIPEIPGNDSTVCSAWMNDNEVVEGSTIVVNNDIDLVPSCEARKFDVKFFVLDNMIDSQSVAYGTAAQAPADPVVEGFRFESWDKEFTNVKADLDVNANMTKMTTVCIVALGETKCLNVPADSTMLTPAAPSDNDSSCTGWTVNGEAFTAESFVASEVSELVAECHANELVVNFFVAEGSNDAVLFNTQTVAYEAAAADPKDEVLEFYGEDYRFDGWDKEFSKVIDNLDVTGKVTKMTTVCVIALGDTTCVKSPADSIMVTPTAPSNSDSTCTGWTVNGEAFTAESFTASEVPELLAGCHANAFDVKFVVFDTVLVDSQRVAYDSNAVAPEVPAFEGYRFDGWDKEFTNVQSDLTVNAKMTAVVDFCTIALGDTTCVKNIPADSTIFTPAAPSNSDSTCPGWLFNGEAFTAESFTASEVPELVAGCHANAFDVKFVAFDTVLVDSQRVAYDSNAVAPEAPVFEGYRFDGWDKEFTNVQSDLTVNANMTAVVDLCVIALGDTTCVKNIPADSIIITPDAPSNSDSSCTGWTVNGEAFTAESFVASEVSELVGVCLAKEFDVKFVAFDTVRVDSQRVAYGQAAVAPDSLVPVFEGFRFNDWDADFTYVEDNMTVNAVFDTLVKVNISIEVSGTTLDSSFYVLKDTVITGLKSMIDSLSGTYFVCSELTVNGAELTDTIVATSDIEVGAVCQPVVHTVRFFVEEKLVHTKSVLHGTACEYTAPAVDGKKFVKWDKNLNVVLEDLDVNGIYVDLDTIKVVVSGEVIDSVVVAKGDSVEYVLPKVQDTDDSAFVGWKVNGELLNAGDTIIVKYGDKEIVASFELGTSLRAVRSVAKFSVFSENGQLQVIGARIGDELTVLDLQGRVIAKKFVQNSVELVSVATRGSYLVRVGTMTKRVVVR